MENLHLLVHEWRLAELREEARRAALGEQALRHSRRQREAAGVRRRRLRWAAGRAAAATKPC
jgi:hypothetical protein